MKRLFALLLTPLFTLSLAAQTDTLQGHWFCREQGVHLYLNLQEEALMVPRYEFLGPVNGYMRGNISDTWFLTSFKRREEGVWTLRLSNDSGADTQEVRITLQPNRALLLKTIGTNYIRRAVRRKWEYLPTEMNFELLP